MKKGKSYIPRVAAIAFYIFFSILPAAAQSREPNITNKVHMISKPAVVRIISGYLGVWAWRGRQWETQSLSSGSGFIINPNGYIMTNAHVVSDIKDGDDKGRRTLLFQLAAQALRALGNPVTEENVIQAARVLSNEAQLTSFRRINLVFLQSGSSYPYEIKSYGAPVGEGKDVSIIKIEIKNAPTLRLGDSDKVEVGDQVWVIGYPAAADSGVLDQKSQLEPTTNDGKISAKKTAADGAPILQTNASTTHGNSGGPVISEEGKVVGLLTFRGNTVNNQEVQGFNFIVPVNTAQEFMRQAGTDNSESLIDAKWVEGLGYYWNQEYSNAQESFAGVLALYADHSEAQKLITESQERIARGEDRSGGAIAGVMVLVGGGLLLLIGAGAVVVFVLMRRKKSTSVPGQQPMSGVQPGYMPSGIVAQQFPPPAGGSTPSHPQWSPTAGDSPKTEIFSPTPSSQARLVFTAGPLQGQEFNIGQGVFVGRDGSRAQIVVADSQVSGQHLWIGVVNGRTIARDSGSTNGTYINNQMDQRITEVELNDRDVLTLGAQGTVKLVFRR